MHTEAPRGRVASIRGADIHFEYDGPEDAPGPVLVLIHGFASSTRTWDRIVPGMAGARRLLRIDLKGFGRSGHPRDGRYSLDENAAIVGELLQREGIGRAVLVGHSYGGAVAILVARAMRVDGLVLIDSACYPQRMPYFVDGLRYRVGRWLSPVFGTAAMKCRVILFTLLVDRSSIDAAMVERYAEGLRMDGANYGYAQTAMQIVPASFAHVVEMLHAVDVPTQIVWGDRDWAVPYAFAARLHADIRGSRLAVLQNVGHMPHEERPADVVRIIEEFLRCLRP